MSETFLHVEYCEKDEVKRLGARWNGTQWYVPAGRDLTPFARWLPDSALAAASSLDNAPTLPVQGLSLRGLCPARLAGITVDSGGIDQSGLPTGPRVSGPGGTG